jgi:phosphoribosylanthranilate isomerase
VIDTVTITGADDGVDPIDLINLSGEFPFVEWGILASTSRRATPRYPSDRWLLSLSDCPFDVTDALGRIHAKCAHNDEHIANLPRGRVRLSLHLCGRVAHELQDGAKHHYAGALAPRTIFRRIQVNGYEPQPSPAFFTMARALPDIELILQARGPGHFEHVEADAREIPNASILFDPSGGRGVEATDIPINFGDRRVGLAGGINPDNVASVHAWAERHGYSWIDMESGVRTDDRFDLAKVRAVLETCARLRGGS